MPMVTSDVNLPGRVASKFEYLDARKGFRPSRKLGRCSGPPWIIDGEDPELYEHLLREVAKAIGPHDIVDWLLIKDVVDIIWEIQRGRRYRESLVRLRKRGALAQFLREMLPRPESILLSLSPKVDEAAELAERWSHGEKAAVKQVEALFEKDCLSMADVAARVLSAIMSMSLSGSTLRRNGAKIGVTGFFNRLSGVE